MEELFTTDAWKSYDQQLQNITKAATQSQSVIEQYVNDQIEEHRRAVKEQQERISSAQAVINSRWAGVANSARLPEVHQPA